MSSSTTSSSLSSSSSSSKPRIRIVMPMSSTIETPARQQTGHHEISPTPRRMDVQMVSSTADDKSRANEINERASPDLSSKVLEGLRNGDLEFPINEECTSLKIVPGGHLVVAGFTDGTLRLFDLTGRPVSRDDPAEHKKNVVVCSKTFQRYGAVACQIHARGVHTSLLMHVDVSDDGLFCFGGVIRGSVELVAVNLSKVHSSSKGDLLDQIHVHRHADAKLKGFGACARLDDQKYLLLTGKGIKNIHIWSFEPKHDRWQCLYDTQTNGNTISILHFRHDPNGLLQAVSKSDLQKLRVWDLSYEQHQGNSSHPLFGTRSTIAHLTKKTPLHSRPKRPPYVDVASTESALGIAGAFCFGGGYNQVSVVGLDVDNVTSPYNVTEMALPGNPAQTSRRQQRGDLQSIVRVAGMSKDADHVLLELSNGSVVHYYQDRNNTRLQLLPMFQVEGTSRNLCVDRIEPPGIVVAAMSTYNANTGRGSIVLHPLDSIDAVLSPVADKKALAAATVSAPSPGVDLFCGQGSTPTVHPTKTKPAVATRVSLHDENEGMTTKSPEGVAVSPELKGELASKEKTKKLGAMMKYLRPVDEEKVTDKATAKAVPKRLHPETKAVPQQALDDRPPKAPKMAAANSPRTIGLNLPLMEKKKPLIDAGNTAQRMISTGTKTKALCSLETAKNDPTSEMVKKVKEKRTRSPSIPRKRLQTPSSVKKRDTTPVIVKHDSLEEEVAATLCYIRRGTPSPKRGPGRPRSNDGNYVKSGSEVAEEERPIHPRRKQPRTLVSQLPKTSVKDRLGTLACEKTDEINARQEASRMKLAAEHRAGHEMLRKKVVSTVDGAIRSLTRSRPLSDNEARIWFSEAIGGYKDMLEDMLARQKMEASALAAEQALERKDPLYNVPELQVSFPFPDLFAVAKRTFERFLLEETVEL